VTEERADRDVEEMTDGPEEQADRMERRSDEVAEHIDEAREQWDRKRSDDAVPGAEPPFDEETDFQDSENPARGPGGPAG
jgi:hypothetical protein